MAEEDTKISNGGRQRGEMNEKKKALTRLPLAERIAQEVRLARELGITVTASEAASIGRPVERRSRVQMEPLHACSGSALASAAEVLMAGHECGQTANLDMHGGVSEVFKSSTFTLAIQEPGIRDMIKALRTAGDVDTLVTRLSAHLDILAARGDHDDLVREAKRAFAQTLFANADPMKSRKDTGGEPNY
jgi:hypothetical protein